MNQLRLLTFFFALSGQVISAVAGHLPETRPALVGSGSKALINLINTDALMKRGVQHAALFFYCVVQPDGTITRFQIYGKADESQQKLKDEVTIRIKQARFVPAVYDHHRVFAAFYGTIAFSVVDAKPHLRIFANQEISELQKETDFIAPQPFELPGHFYDWVKYPARSVATDDRGATAELLLYIDASGHLKDIRVIKETPLKADTPGVKFGETATKILKQRTYLPAFRNGVPVESTTHCTIYFVPGGWSLQ